MNLDREHYFDLISGKARRPLAMLGRAGLLGASWGYGLGASWRNGMFDRGWRRIHRPTVPVISVGNLTMGGTGKTPFVEWVCRLLRQHGLRTTILSRGYGHSGGLNDEGLVLDANLPDVPHLQGPDRVRLAEIAVEELEAEVLVLDDGFQHRRLGRTLDIVLLDALEPFGFGYLTPRGLLREPISSLRRADVIVLSRADLVDQQQRDAIRSQVERAAGSLCWAEARHAPRDLLGADGSAEPVADMGSRRIAAFCGIGNPEGFRRTLANLGARIAAFRAFPDHHPYEATDVHDLIAWARASGAELVLTT